MIELDPKTSALILIDLQAGIVGMPLQPRSGPETLAAGKALAEKFRAAGAKVVLVRVDFAPDFADALQQPVDTPFRGARPPGWSALAEGLAEPSDILIVKRQWGAFHGTELDLQLRRRGVRTIVLGGIATNIGVESTARHGWELGYELVLVEDACTSRSAELHDMAIRFIFPKIARVRQAADIVLAAERG